MHGAIGLKHCLSSAISFLQGKTVVCYISAGTYESNRPDSSKFSDQVTTKKMKVYGSRPSNVSFFFVAFSAFSPSAVPGRCIKLRFATQEPRT